MTKTALITQRVVSTLNPTCRLSLWSSALLSLSSLLTVSYSRCSINEFHLQKLGGNKRYLDRYHVCFQVQMSINEKFLPTTAVLSCFV